MFTVNYEGPEAIEPVPSTKETKPPAVKKQRRTAPSKTKRDADLSDLTESADDGDAHGGTDDEEYVDGEAEHKQKGKRVAVRRVISDSDDELNGGPASPSTHKVKVQPKTPTPEVPQRRASTASLADAPQPPKKRQRTTSAAARESPVASGASEDKLRKHVLGDFCKLFAKIFQAYPYVVRASEGEVGPEGEPSGPVEAKWGELTDEEKSAVGDAANAYATAAEEALFEACGEHDKQKFKSLYLMLKFNLSKDDRDVVHKRIASGALPAATLVHMSPEDLASEDQQKSRRELEDEALAQSILQKTRAPTAKITHKGFEDIEDVTGERTNQRAREEALEKEEEARTRRERERLARLKPVHTHAVQSPTTSSIPPGSPMLATPSTPVSASWGAPPPVPLHAISGDGSAAATSASPIGRSPVAQLFFNTPSDANAGGSEHDIDLGDFIHMDDDPPAASPDGVPSKLPTPALELDKLPPAPSAPSPLTTGLSPFASAQPDIPRASFDLSSVWTTEQKPIDHPSTPSSNKSPAEPEEHGHVPMDVDYSGEPDNEKLNFDIFLNKDDEEEAEKPVEPPQPALTPEELFEKLPRVWNGVVSMPIDTMVPEETKVSARQIGGRTIDPESPLWHTLCPSDIFRIDGRVPVAHSSKYLLESRMAPAKELVAITLTPESEQALSVLQAISRFLKGKDRHGLIFPWGKRGKEWGSELYIVPLSKGEPLPESIELLDNLKLPKQRKEDCFVGIWVLNRGRLQPPPPSMMHVRPPPPPQSHSLPPHLPPQAAPVALPHIVTPPQPPVFSPPNAISLPANLLAALSGLSGPSNANPAPPTPALYAPPQPVLGVPLPAPPAATAPTLAGLSNLSLEELAALPMEQLQSIAQLLQGTSGVPSTSAAVPPHLPPASASWSPPRGGFDAGYDLMPHQQDYHDRPGPAHGGGFGARGGDRDRDRDRGEFRGRGRSKGRGGPRGRGQGSFGTGRRGGGGGGDSGWRGRGRG